MTAAGNTRLSGPDIGGPLDCTVSRQSVGLAFTSKLTFWCSCTPDRTAATAPQMFKQKYKQRKTIPCPALALRGGLAPQEWDMSGPQAKRLRPPSASRRSEVHR